MPEATNLASAAPEHPPRSQRVSDGVSLYSGTAISRDEMNLAEFPLAVLSTRSNPNLKTLEFSDTKKRNGELVERKWVITGADKFGLPTATDDDVILGLIRLSIDTGFRDRKVFFTRYELLRILRWSTEGRSYSRLVKSLDRLSGVRIRASNAFYDNSTKSHQTCNFGIIDAYELNDGRGGKSDTESNGKSYFIWSEILFDSFQSGFIKKLDLDLYFGLRSSISRRLYRHLDKHFYYKSFFEQPLLNFAFEKIGLSRSYRYVSSVKQQLEPAAEELVKIGFLERYEYIGKGEATVVRFTQKRNFSVPGKSIETVAATQTQSAQVTSSIEALVSRGITLNQARRLLERKSEQELNQVEEILRYYDHLVETKDKKISKNRIGFLYRAVESPFRFIIPASFANKPSASLPRPDSRSQRPELKIFTADTPFRSAPNVAKTAPPKRAAVSQNHFRFEPKNEEAVKLRAEISEKLAPLRDVLGDERFRKTLEACVEEEILRRGESKQSRAGAI